MYFLAEAVILVVLALSAVSVQKYAEIRKSSSQEPTKASKLFKDLILSLVHSRHPIKQGLKPYKFPPLKMGASTQMTMGLKRLESCNWLTMDDQYLEEHNIRAVHLSDALPSVLQCLPGSEVACQEALTRVSTFLASRYPLMFKFSSYGSRRLIHNLKTGEKFPVVNNSRPLETAARLAMEDFNVLVKDPNDGEYRLKASATLFPAGWKLQERIGCTLTQLHCPVPGWKQKLGSNVNRYFDNLKASNSMERHTLFVQTTPGLFQDEALCSVAADSITDVADQCAIAEEDITSSESDSTPSSPYGHKPVTAIAQLNDIHVRRERQTFVRLSTSGAILFTVRTYMVPLTSLGDVELAALVEQALGWAKENAVYKGREKWLDTVLQYQKSRKLGLTTTD